ncbi:XRE family transcriptional regulator [Rouxiella badensis]|nr:XRE family transcriptional regulator [Rouxiella badensis]
MADLAFINPQILSWARARAQMSEDALSAGLGVKVDKIISWEEGTANPTFIQAQKLASKLHVPFAYFFLKRPPVEPLPIPDLRTVRNQALRNPSVEMLDTIRAVMSKQDWYKEYLLDQGAEPLPFIGRFNVNSDVREVAQDIRDVLGLNDLNPRGLDWEDYQRKIVTAAEAAGILIMRSGIVGNNTHRPLNVSEFRGFAISDPLAPVVFINLTDAPTARLFTLLHELCHLWIGQSGISSVSADDERREERFCNAVAGEFLASEREMRNHWSREKTLQQNAADISKILHVSRYVIARRALDLGFIEKDEYNEYYQTLMAEFHDKSGGGGNFYAMTTNKNSARFSKAVLNEALSGRVLLRDAGKLLGVAPAKLKKYAMELSA